MTNPWPEEESPESKFGGVFDEALKPPMRELDIRKRILEIGGELRRRGVLPSDRERALEQVEHFVASEILIGSVMRTNGSDWRNHLANCLPDYGGPLPVGDAEARRARDRSVATHWLTCETCQAATSGRASP